MSKLNGCPEYYSGFSHKHFQGMVSKCLAFMTLVQFMKCASSEINVYIYIVLCVGMRFPTMSAYACLCMIKGNAKENGVSLFSQTMFPNTALPFAQDDVMQMKAQTAWLTNKVGVFDP